MLLQILKVLPTGMNSAILNFLEELDTCITLQNINLGLFVYVHCTVCPGMDPCTDDVTLCFICVLSYGAQWTVVPHWLHRKVHL